MTTPTTVQVRLQIRADTAANWTSVNPILLANELGLETDTKKFKIGDGTTTWNSLAYFPSIVSGGTVLGNLEIGTTGTLTFEGSTADGFETTLGVVDPTADRTILLPNQSGTVVVGGNASITNADIAANAEIAVSKLANGTANQVLVTDGTDVSWSDNLTLAGDLTVNGTTTTINTETLTVKDKNIELAVVATPTDVTADGGGITLKGATDKTINWIDATDAWTSSERFSVPLGSAAAPSLTFTGDENTGIYSPGADQLALSTNGTGRLFINGSGKLLVGTDLDYAENVQAAFYGASNGGIALAAGTSGLSRLMFADDIAGNSGAYVGSIIYSHADDSLRFNVNGGTERLRIDSSGRVGIGTSSPSEKLSINEGNIKLTSTDTFHYIALSNTSAGGRQWTLANAGASDPNGVTAGNLYLRDSTAGANRIAIDSSGRLGIGSTSPGTNTSNNANQLVVGDNSAAAERGITIGSTTGGGIRFNDGADAGLIEYSHASNFMRFLVNGSEAYRVDSSQRLLVGTSSARGRYTLQLEGNSDSSTDVGELWMGRPLADGSISSGTGLGKVYFGGQSGGVGAKIEGIADAQWGTNDYPGRLVFSTTSDGASSPTERLRLDRNGNLHLGVYTNPTGGTGIMTAVAYAMKQGVNGAPTGNGFNWYWNGSSLSAWVDTSNVGTVTLTSDYRIKKDVVLQSANATERIKKLRPVEYQYKDYGEVFKADGVQREGFIAHELAEVIPSAVEGEKDAENQIQSLRVDALVSVLTKALQESITRIETLEAKVAALESV